MHDIQAVVFDAFGTLIQYTGPWNHPYRHVLAHIDASTRLPFMTRNVPIDIFADELGLSHVVPDMRRELDALLASLRLFPEVSTVLNAVRASGRPIAVCSNLAYDFGGALYRLLPDMDAYLLSYALGVAKPDPAMYAAVCTALACPPEHLLFIGDSQRCDVDGPRASGLQARRLNRRQGMTLFDTLEGVI
ncbi:HAD-IA family hydrolase [Burkholderiaceae bacterium DAT-1]|nr:HAD-IA family hydrolase [Burkholderiaceae bacterium DAT-1]